MKPLDTHPTSCVFVPFVSFVAKETNNKKG